MICLLLMTLTLGGERVWAQSTPPPERVEIPLYFGYTEAVRASVIAFQEGDAYFLPLLGLFDVMQIRSERTPSHITGFVGDTSFTYAFDLDTGTVTVRDATWQVPANAWFLAQGDLLLAMPWYETLFGLRFEIDFGRLALRLRTDTAIPAVEALYRAARRDALTRARDTPSSVERRIPLRRKAFGTGVMDYQISTSAAPFPDPDRPESGGSGALGYRVRVGLEAFGGGLEASVNGAAIAVGAQAPRLQGRWHYVWDPNPWLRRLDLGQVFSSGLRALPYQGVRITNAPVPYREALGREVIVARAEPGWEAELYANDRLVAFATTDAQGEVRFTVPVSYGSSRYTIRFFGPHGERRDEEHHVIVPTAFVPNGALDYDAGLGRGTLDGGTYAFGNLAYGVHPRWTGRLGVEYFDSPYFGRPVVFGELLGRVGLPYVVQLRAAPGALYSAGVQAYYTTNITWGADYTRFDRQALFINPSRLRHQASARASVPVRVGPLGGALSVSGQWNQTEALDQLRLSAMANVLIRRLFVGMRLTGAYRWSDTGNQLTSARLETTLRARPSIPRESGLGAWLNGLLLTARSSVDVRYGQLGMVTLAAARPVRIGRTRRQSSLGVQVSRDFNSGLATFGIRLGLNFTAVSNQFLIEGRNVGEPLRVVNQLRGGLAYDETTHDVFMSAAPWVGRGAITLRSFLDADADGVLDPGETLLENPALAFERQGAVVDASQEDAVRFHNLTPYLEYRTTVQERSLMNPLWVPAWRTFSFRPSPNVHRPLDLPFYAAGVLEGRVELHGPARAPLGGLRVHVRGVDHASHQELRTFSDGVYYTDRLRPGVYEVYVDSAQTAWYDAKAAPGTHLVVVRITEHGEVIQGVDFVLIPKRLPVRAPTVRAPLEATPRPMPEAWKPTFTPPPPIRFGFDAARLPSAAATALDTFAVRLSRLPGWQVAVVGHADAKGPAAYNRRLSERRAQAVADRLVAAGLPASRVLVDGVGEERPVPANASSEGRAANRRVELRLSWWLARIPFW